MIGFVVFLTSIMGFYIPFLIYHIINDIIFTLFFSCTLLTLPGILLVVLYNDNWDKNVLWINNKEIISKYNRWYSSIIINGFLSGILFSISPFLCIFVFALFLLINIFSFKREATNFVNQWNDSYDSSLYYITLETQKLKFSRNMRILRDSCIFSGPIILLINGLFYCSNIIKNIYVNLPTISYFSKITKQAKGFDDEKLPQ